jgi:hypothetical protein
VLRATIFAVPVLVATYTDCGGGSNLDPVNDASFEIREGKHDSNPAGLKKMQVESEVDRLLTFQAFFHSDAAYLTTDPVNQHDWNKLMGITAVDIHGNSIRTGWRYEPSTDQIELGFYGYRDGVRVSQQLTEVDLEEWVDVTLEFTEDRYYAEVNGHAHEVAGPSDPGLFDRTTWVLRTAYFGGDETAPHDIHIDVRDVWTDN